MFDMKDDNRILNARKRDSFNFSLISTNMLADDRKHVLVKAFKGAKRTNKFDTSGNTYPLRMTMSIRRWQEIQTLR